MYRAVFVFILTCVASSVALQEDERLIACNNLYTLENLKIKCCNNGLPNTTEILRKDIHDCFSAGSYDEHDCEPDICLAKKNNWLGTAEGSFDEEAAKRAINTLFDDEFPQLAANMTANCIKRIDAQSTCKLKMFHLCVNVLMIVSCPDWKSEGECSVTKEEVEKCRVRDFYKYNH